MKRLALAIIAIILSGLVGGYFIFLGVLLITYEPTDPAVEAREALRVINEYRATENQAELRWDYELAEMAMSHSQEMKDANSFYHSDYPYFECILQGAATSERIVELWQESPAHNQIILWSSLESGAVGIAGDYATFIAR